LIIATLGGRLESGLLVAGCVFLAEADAFAVVFFVVVFFVFGFLVVFLAVVVFLLVVFLIAIFFSP
jgi:hypothetical protein